MNILGTTQFDNLNISQETTVLTYTTTQTLFIVTQVALNNCQSANYDIRLYINNNLAIPDRQVPTSVQNVIAQSRSVVVEVGDVLTVTITGTALDTNISGTVILADVTPVSVQDVINQILPIISQSIINDIANVEIRPTVNVLGPCEKGITKFDLPKPCH